ncbi:hypothetical protein ACFQ0N_26560 [Paenibacillus sp. GCM10027626]
MRKINHKHAKYVVYTTIFIFIAFFFFVNNNWMKRIYLMALAGVLLIIMKFVPKKYAGFALISTFIVFKVIDEFIITQE